MAEFREDIDVYPTLVKLSGCIELELIASGLPGVCRNGIEPGAVVAFDFVEDPTETTNGQAFVRVVNAFPSSSFPNPDDGMTMCGAPLAYLLEVGIVRCTLGEAMPDGSIAYDAEQALTDTRLQMADMAALMRAIRCCLKGNSDLELSVGTYEPYGPEGGLVGGSWTITVGSARG